MIPASLALLAWVTLTMAAHGRWATGVFEAGSLLLGVFWIVEAARTKAVARIGFPLAMLCTPLLCAAGQLLAGVTVYPHETTVALLHWSSLFAVAFVCRQSFTAPERTGLFLDGVAVFAGLIAFYVLLQPYLGGRHLGGLLPVSTEEMAGPFQNRNTFASLIELALPVALWRALRSAGASPLWLTAAAVMLASVAGAAARAGSILVFVELGVFLALAGVRRLAPAWRIGMAALQMAALAGIWVILAGWSRLWERLQFADPLFERREILFSSLAMVWERPWAGFGMGTFSAAYPRFARFDTGFLVNFAHNDWLQWGVEGGIFLFAAMAAMACWCCLRAWRHPWSLGLAFVFLHATVDYPMQRAGMAAWIFVMVAALEAAEARRIRSARNALQPEPHAGQPPPVQEAAAVHH